MNRMIFVCIIILSINCASTTQFVKYPDQSVNIEDTTKSRIYVYRPVNAMNSISASVISGNKLIGITGARGFLCWEEEPGQTKILSKAENTDTIIFLSNRGQQYYLKQSMTGGAFYARNKLALVQKKEAQEEMASCLQPVLSSESKSTYKNDSVKQSQPSDSNASIQKISQNDNQIIEKTKTKNTNIAVLSLLITLGLSITTFLIMH